MTHSFAEWLRTLGTGLLLAACPAISWAAARQYQTGTLMVMEQEKVKTGSTTFRHDEGQAKHANGNAKYSGDETTMKSDDVDTYEVYTIRMNNKTYVAREKLNFPWSKPASVTMGDSLQFAIEGNKLYVLGTEGKEHKASIVRVSLTTQ